MTIYVGTSGFQYPHWNNGVFYPRGVKDRLAYALARFNVVEVNTTFYSIPRPDVVASWAAKVPEGAKLVLKVPQSVSHRRRLKLHSDPRIKQGKDLLLYFVEGVLRIDENKRGPVLLQLPNRMEADTERLEAVLKLFREAGVKLALEIRHPSWFDADILALLARYNAALAASDWPEFATPLVLTADFSYVRRHGPAAVYASAYDDTALRADIDMLLAQQTGEAYVLFNNDIGAYAPMNALRMRELLADEYRMGDMQPMSRQNPTQHIAARA